MVKVLENVLRGIICSFPVNNWSNLWRYWNRIFALFPAAIFVLLGGAQYCAPIVSPINFCYIFLKNNSAAENCTHVRLSQVVNLSEILSFRHSTVLMLVFDGVTVKTTKLTTFFSNYILFLRCLSRITSLALRKIMFRNIAYPAKKNGQKTLVAIIKNKKQFDSYIRYKKKHIPRLVGNMESLASNLYHFDMS